MLRKMFLVTAVALFLLPATAAQAQFQQGDWIIPSQRALESFQRLFVE